MEPVVQSSAPSLQHSNQISSNHFQQLQFHRVFFSCLYIFREIETNLQDMAAYAALASLMNTVDNIQIHPRLSTSLDNYQVATLRETLDFLLRFTESCTYQGGKIKEEFADLESQITSAAHEAEEVIESHIVEQIHADSYKKSLRCLFDLQKVILDINCINEQVNERSLKDQRPKPTMSAASSSSKPLTTKKITLIGFRSYQDQLLDWLTGISHQQIIPITGMGGTGKTALARSIYEDSLITHHFDICAWVTISQEYNVAEILSEILSCIRGSIGRMETEDQLGEQLHKILFGRRYLIVLDDVWSIEAWSRIRFYFPQNDGGSRIVVTTRQLDVANFCGALHLAVDFLDDGNSWDLFCEKAFAEGCCPLELEEIGKKIVKKCRGLPLSIVVIAGLLATSSNAKEYWENVEKDLSSILNSSEENHCLNVLSLSYNYLPACLKPCFLYLGIFPEDHKIPVSRLIKLWIAEGFLKPNKQRCLEEVAEGYIKALIEKNLLYAHSFGGNGKLKLCSIHDLIRDLCIKVAEKESFFRLAWEIDALGDIERERRIIAHRKHQVVHTLSSETKSSARSVIGEGQFLLSLNSRLLRILSYAYGDCIDTTLQRVNLRFLEYMTVRPDQIHSSVSLLWNLQTLIIEGRVSTTVVPFEIWAMPQLRHVIFKQGLHLPEPSGDAVVLENLQTLRNVGNFKISEEACVRMPNVKKLRVYFDQEFDGGHTMSYYGLYNIGRLDKLESLYLRYILDREDLLRNLKLPGSLRELTLAECNLRWDDLTVLGSLPNLEVLKLYVDSARGSEWNPVEGEFQSLKYLKIWDCSDLVCWNADSSHFPILESIDLQYLDKLDEIPLDIGNIPTLRDIFMSECSVSAAVSAVKILEEQESYENQDIRVRVKFWKEKSKTKLEEVRETVEVLGFESHHFELFS